MRRRAVSIAVALVAMGACRLSAAQCTVDTDCKGNRICQNGVCTEAPGATDAAPPPAEYTGTPAGDAGAPTAPVAAGGFHPFVVGAFMSMGMAMTVGDLKMGYDQKPRFAGGGGAYFDFYLTEMFALEGGVGFIGKGYRLKEEILDEEYKAWTRIIEMEIPLGVKLNIKGFQASVAIAIDFALSGKTKAKSDNSENTHTWGDDDWDLCRRANLGPRVALGYAIPIGPVALVPGLSWSMDLINQAKGDAADADVKARGMNLMFNVGAEFGFGG
jgi:hypothetical protein